MTPLDWARLAQTIVLLLLCIPMVPIIIRSHKTIRRLERKEREMGGKPKKSTPADRRLKENKPKPAMPKPKGGK